MTFKRPKASAPGVEDRLSTALSKTVDLLGELDSSKKEIERKREAARADFLEQAEEMVQRDPSATDEEAFKARFKWVSSDGTFAYQRTPVEKGIGFDSERFVADHPDIKLVKAVTTYVLDEEATERYISENPEFLPILQQYVTPGRTEIHLKRVKPNEQP